MGKMNLPDLRVGGTVFFGHEMTYCHIIQDFFFLLSFLTFMYDLADTVAKSGGGGRRIVQVSSKSQYLYALTFTFRIVEFNPLSYFFFYELISCAVFAALSWTGLLAYSYAAKLMSPERGGVTKNADSFQTHFVVGITAGLAYLFNYSHIKLTGKLFCWAWSHYLEGVALLPQFWLVFQISRKKIPISKNIWLAMNLMAVSRIFQLLNWAYLHVQLQMLDHLAVASALFHLSTYLFFCLWLFIGDKKRVDLDNLT